MIRFTPRIKLHHGRWTVFVPVWCQHTKETRKALNFVAELNKRSGR